MTFKKRVVRIGGWYVKKNFPHFDLTLGFDQALALASNPARVSEHAFWPFIGYVDQKRKFSKLKNRAPEVSNKERPLRYCSHHDGYIHAYYAKSLSERYEVFVRSYGLENAVIGYRKGLGTNVDLAKSAFDEIKLRETSCVIALDITDFFGSIDHHVLKQNLCELLEQSQLPVDWYKIYRSMTKFSWVELSELADRLGFDQDKVPRPICSADSFRQKVRGGDGLNSSLVRTNAKDHGIPQGSPLSAVFSNVYMMHFDIACSREFHSRGDFYRRYSDDIIIICDVDRAGEAIDFVERQIADLGSSLKLNNAKTEVSVFERIGPDVFVCDRPVTYLGLTYDGKRTLLRARTLSRYYRRMTYAARQAIRSAKKSESKKLFLRSTYRDLTHLGGRNFYSYAKRASKTLKDVSAAKQLRRHFPILHRKLKTGGK
ncbi:MAG: antiviral reverse transcriptase Drt2 [Xanthobacteraceae bacterium]